MGHAFLFFFFSLFETSGHILVCNFGYYSRVGAIQSVGLHRADGAIV